MIYLNNFTFPCLFCNNELNYSFVADIFTLKEKNIGIIPCYHHENFPIGYEIWKSSKGNYIKNIYAIYGDHGIKIVINSDGRIPSGESFFIKRSNGMWVTQQTLPPWFFLEDAEALKRKIKTIILFS